jgi:hypothetical protein
VAYIGRDYEANADRQVGWLEILITPLPVFFAAVFIRPAAMIR